MLCLGRTRRIVHVVALVYAKVVDKFSCHSEVMNKLENLSSIRSQMERLPREEK